LRCVLGAVTRSILLAAFVAAGAGCGRRSYCEIVCHCRADNGCLSGTLVSCESKATGDEEASQELGCSKEYEALASCLDDTAVCFSDWTVTTSCDVQQSVWNKCMAAAQGK